MSLFRHSEKDLAALRLDSVLDFHNTVVGVDEKKECVESRNPVVEFDKELFLVEDKKDRWIPASEAVVRRCSIK